MRKPQIKITNLSLRRSYLIPIVVVLTLILIIIILLSLLGKGKWKNYDAEVLRYVVLTAPTPEENLEYSIDLRYKYNYNNLNYVSNFNKSGVNDPEFVSELKDKYKEGDKVKIRFNKNNPDENEVLDF